LIGSAQVNNQGDPEPAATAPSPHTNHVSAELNVALPAEDSGDKLQAELIDVPSSRVNEGKCGRV